ncbi:MAG TPA: bifunctional 2-polyprenyl-6-hydroxyphenol methylase/3-demethylubiquinol 3-O-methyltransferase UbiG [Stellaceae bacterium]|jgi:2-polyprenyl-6-hydroxyphenyl methylase/3-demethylubiquinone-9 3-methyltransferase|nr:bifunctional 2-polyprenyl-6-hydroxyphenol methylase/3-demethylubiquinol 3-O-methyltransferase UbiG [Stellaceae bacterium]
MRENAAEPKEERTVDREEVERFTRIARAWWEPEGEFRALHKLNPVRLGFIRDRLAAHFGRDARAMRPFAGLRLLDIGCGGGLVSEPLARLGFAVTGIDAGEAMLEVARGHAAASGVAVDYRRGTAEDLAAGGERFDAVLALEVVEHVAAPELFLAAAARLVRPGGALVAATINRTPKAFLFAIVGAEYLLRWLPRGTHQWDKFLRPSELAAGLRPGGVVVKELSGLAYNPLADRWSLTADLDVNYMLFAVKPNESPGGASQP